MINRHGAWDGVEGVDIHERERSEAALEGHVDFWVLWVEIWRHANTYHKDAAQCFLRALYPYTAPLPYKTNHKKYVALHPCASCVSTCLSRGHEKLENLPNKRCCSARDVIINVREVEQRAELRAPARWSASHTLQHLHSSIGVSHTG